MMLSGHGKDCPLGKGGGLRPCHPFFYFTMGDFRFTQPQQQRGSGYLYLPIVSDRKEGFAVMEVQV